MYISKVIAVSTAIVLGALIAVPASAAEPAMEGHISMPRAVGSGVGTSGFALAQPKLTIYQTTLEEPKQVTPEVTTEELKAILANGREQVFDTRPAKEYAIAHIPGSINLYEKEVERITQSYPDKATRIVLHCNGPFCGKSKRVSEELVKLGYTNVKRYQLGLPVWRALGNTSQTGLEGVRYILKDDKTAVFVDARARAEFEAGSVAGAVNVRAGEARKASDNGVLPYLDHGTRVVVFANSAQEARAVAEEIAKIAYWNSSYFGGTYEELKRAGLSRLVFPLSAHAQGTDAESVLKTREAALVGRDLNAILTLFADDAIVVTSSGRLLIGKEQISVWAQDQVDRQQREEAGPRQVHGNKLSWPGKVYRDDWQKLGVSPLDVTQDAIIQGGKIKFFSTTFTPESWVRLEAARKKK